MNRNFSKKRENTNILLVGAGAVGSILANLLYNKKGINLKIADREFKTNSLKIKKTRLLKVDISKIEKMKKISVGSDIIINASLPNFNELIMKTAITVKANYQDMCSLLADLKEPEQLKYHDKFRKVGITGLINTGISPGITNLLAKHMSSKFAKVNNVKIRTLEHQDSSRFIPMWSVKTTLDELLSAPLIYKRKKFIIVKPFQDPEIYRFPKKYGYQKVYTIYGDEVATIPKFIDLRRIDYKAGGHDIEYFYNFFKKNVKKNLNKAKHSSTRARLEKIIGRIPSGDELGVLIKDQVLRNGFFLAVVEMNGFDQNQKRARARYYIEPPELIKISRVSPGYNYISYPTALAAMAFLMNFNNVKKPGVFPPESLDFSVVNSIIKGIKEMGIKIGIYQFTNRQ